jgi:outer membrane protein assembly factor BamC
MTHRTLVCSALALTLLAGCSGNILPDSKKIEYKSAGKLPPLEIPPDLTQPSRDERYAVPDTSARGSATFSAYTSDRSGQSRTTTAQDVLPQVDKMRIERSGTQRWLVLNGVPEKMWPTVKEFWQEMGFLVNIEVPEAGIMETDWAENRAKLPQDIIRGALGKVFESLYSTPERDKFRTRLEKGTQPGTMEIYISHRGMYEIYVNEGKSDTRWQPRPADPELEAEMLSRLMVRLGVDEVRAKAMIGSGTTQERAKIVQSKDGASSLTLDEAFDRAWRRVGLALDRVGFTVEDRDRSKGLYFVRYVDPETDGKTKKDEGGFLSKLAFWKSSSENLDKAAQYRVYVKEGATDTTVQVMTREGGNDKSETSRKILTLLYAQLK